MLEWGLDIATLQGVQYSAMLLSCSLTTLHLCRLVHPELARQPSSRTWHLPMAHRTRVRLSASKPPTRNLAI